MTQASLLKVGGVDMMLERATLEGLQTVALVLLRPVYRFLDAGIESCWS